MKSNKKYKKIFKLISLNIAVFFTLILFMEIFSFSVLYFYKKSVSNKNQKIETSYSKEIKDDDALKNPLYSSQELKKKFLKSISQEDKTYRYFSHLVYKNKKFKSEFLNIDNNGIRLNGKKNKKKGNKDNEINIWFSGGSNIFGVTNADHQTVPAYLEKKLSENYENIKFNVLNLGVVGYTSIQELINIRLLLLSDLKKPDLIIVMNGINDYHHALLSKKDNFEDLLRTGLGSDKILDYYWSFHNEKKLFNKYQIINNLKYVFSNTILLIEKANKYFVLKKANSDIDLFKKKYLQKKAISKELIDKNLQRNKEYYIGNMRLIAELAKNNGSKVLFILQPTLYEAEEIKNLVAQEVSEYIHTQTGYFALSDNDVKKIQEVKSTLVLAKYHWDLKKYILDYKNLRNSLDALCISMKIDCISMNKAIIENKSKPIFSSPYHYTYIGAEIFAETIKNHYHNKKYSFDE